MCSLIYRLSILTATLLLGATFALRVIASPSIPEEGFDYRLVEKSEGAKSGSKIEVVEFFWYDCPHCNAMLPLIEPWAKRQKSKITFTRIPVARNEGAIQQQHLYYALETLGKIEVLHEQLFHAIHDENISLKTPEQMADFLGKQGIKRADFLKAFHAARVKRKVQLAQQITAKYNVNSVPTILVDRQFLTSANMIGGNQADVLPIVDYLIKKSK